MFGFSRARVDLLKKKMGTGAGVGEKVSLLKKSMELLCQKYGSAMMMMMFRMYQKNI
eukprot:gnl/Chilomastix_caulleri/6995.p2 GENE.gnl/Chilomastix_caulleri/6995~~gnl/Chilomastix_caulleri/6995.p2  ORF type:complete len:57 (+),score=16.77 gnl/Chilomastix_caulleri/6995:258-428(+)